VGSGRVMYKRPAGYINGQGAVLGVPVGSFLGAQLATELTRGRVGSPGRAFSGRSAGYGDRWGTCWESRPGLYCMSVTFIQGTPPS
jgi:hypothetical protein